MTYDNKNGFVHDTTNQHFGSSINVYFLEDFWFYQNDAIIQLDKIVLLGQKFPWYIIFGNIDVKTPRSSNSTLLVYKNNPKSIPELKDEIIFVITEISNHKLGTQFFKKSITKTFDYG